MLWDREKSLLPSAQGLASARLNEQRVKQYNKYIEEVQALESNLDKHLFETISLRKEINEQFIKYKQCSPQEPSALIIKAGIINKLQYLELTHPGSQPVVTNRGKPSRFLHLTLETIKSIKLPDNLLDINNQEILSLMEAKSEFFQHIIGFKPSTLFDALYKNSGNGSDEDVEPSTESSSEEQLSVVKQPKFMRECPNESCRGFCNIQGVCDICKTGICTKCWAKLAEGETRSTHMCKQEDLESKQLIASESKPCPKCHVPIFRISGCDHMFCTNCKTGFNWRTGKQINNSHNTNPMLAEWQRTNNIQETNECRDGPIHEVAQRLSRKIAGYNLLKDISATSTHRVDFFSRLDNTLMIFRNFLNNRHTVDLEEANQELRIRFLLHEIDEKTFKTQALTKVREQKSRQDLRDLQEMFCTAMLELLTQVESFVQNHGKIKTARNNRTSKDWSSLYTDFAPFFTEWQKRAEELRQYYNANLTGIAMRHYAKIDIGLYTNNILSEDWKFSGHS